jgi:hypothetical protein
VANLSAKESAAFSAIGEVVCLLRPLERADEALADLVGSVPE